MTTDIADARFARHTVELLARAFATQDAAAATRILVQFTDDPPVLRRALHQLAAAFTAHDHDAARRVLLALMP